MKKIDTTRIKRDFARTLTSKRLWLDRVSSRLAGTSTELTDLNLLCENYLASVYVDFECFLSDLFHGYINNDSKPYMSFVEKQMKQALSSKYSTWHVSHVTFQPPKHIDSDTLRTLLDPHDWNITFKDVQSLKARANDWLSARYAQHFAAISVTDTALIEAAHALRNCIAHNSENSRRLMNARIRAISTGPNCVNQTLAAGINGINSVGKYLRAATSRGMRAAVYSDRIAAISATL